MKKFIRRYIETRLFKSIVRSKKLLNATNEDQILELKNDIGKLEILLCIWILSRRLGRLQKYLMNQER